ncbi:MAG: hypothetical protein HQM10_14335 [Candidatus Riflebacteria bacterium]|nr:hypothetical protein [Candidatus Riflebacteria bacterium]
MGNGLSKRGGKRPGAGRPKQVYGVKVSVSLMVTPEVLRQLDRYALDNDLSRSQAAENLMRTALLDEKSNEAEVNDLEAFDSAR